MKKYRNLPQILLGWLVEFLLEVDESVDQFLLFRAQGLDSAITRQDHRFLLLRQLSTSSEQRDV